MSAWQHGGPVVLEGERRGQLGRAGGRHAGRTFIVGHARVDRDDDPGTTLHRGAHFVQVIWLAGWGGNM